MTTEQKKARQHVIIMVIWAVIIRFYPSSNNTVVPPFLWFGLRQWLTDSTECASLGECCWGHGLQWLTGWLNKWWVSSRVLMKWIAAFGDSCRKMREEKAPLFKWITKVAIGVAQKNLKLSYNTRKVKNSLESIVVSPL